MRSDPDSSRSPAVGSLRRVLDSVLAVAENRLELLATEFRLEKCRLIALLVLTVCAVFFGVLAVSLLAVTLVLLVPVAYRTHVVAGICLVCAVAALASVLQLRTRLRQPPPFRETLQQLKKDRQWFTARR
ncbi:MAG: phage holin family protein [Verrucomicrobia bacterium]|nr:phage holin family protein [Verrucomicrobiota bacterium]